MGVQIYMLSLIRYKKIFEKYSKNDRVLGFLLLLLGFSE